MAPIPTDRQDWLPELVTALRSVANALASRKPTPKRIAAVAFRFAEAVPDHQVELHWFERGYLNDPDIDEPGEAEYAITISGDRLLAGWLILASDLPGLLKLSISD